MSAAKKKKRDIQLCDHCNKELECLGEDKFGEDVYDFVWSRKSEKAFCSEQCKFEDQYGPFSDEEQEKEEKQDKEAEDQEPEEEEEEPQKQDAKDQNIGTTDKTQEKTTIN